MRYRSGATLTEVLIAIFCAGIGMISLLALFPVGLLNMAASVRNHRTAIAAGNAEAIAEMFNLRGRPELFNTVLVPGPVPTIMTSNVVIIDPIAIENYAAGGDELPSKAAARDVEENPPPKGIPRKAGPFPPGQAYRWFSLEDDINFDKSGAPLASGVERERRYSWAYLLRRPDASKPEVVEISILLFANRKIRLDGGGPPGTPVVPTGEDAYTGLPGHKDVKKRVFFAGEARAVLTWTHGSKRPPTIKKGTWLLDATTTEETVAGPPTRHLRYCNGYTYRVVAFGEPVFDQGKMQQEVTLETPARADGTLAVVLEAAAAMIDKSDGKMPQ